MHTESFNPNTIGTHVTDCQALMLPHEHDFLLWMLNKYKPRKILEVGVHAGGTSALILKNTPANSTLHAVDIAVQCDSRHGVGYKVDEICSESEKKRYKRYLGRDVIYTLPEIGDEIDLCVLDTVHQTPGELLQFFAIYPYFKKGAFLVLHDLSLNMLGSAYSSIEKEKFSFATRLLFSLIGSSLKILPERPLPNIGAVKIDDNTRKHLSSTFFGLGITWFYYPSDLIPVYSNFIHTHYDKFCAEIFDTCINGQKKIMEKHRRI